MSVYKIQSQRSTFFAFDDNDNGRLDRQESVFLDADANQRISGPDIVVSHTVLTDALAPYGVRSIRRLSLPGLEKYTALFREFEQHEADAAVAFYWQLYGGLVVSGLETGLSERSLSPVLPSVDDIRSAYRAAFSSTLSKLDKAILAGANASPIQFAISATLGMMQEAETSRRALGLSQALFSVGDEHKFYRTLFVAYQTRAEMVRPALFGMSASLAYQEDGLFEDDGQFLRQTAYTIKTDEIANYLLLRHWEDLFGRLAGNPQQAIPDDLQTILIPLAPVIIKEFLDDGELEAAALTWRAYVTSPFLEREDFTAEGLLVQKAITQAAIEALKVGDDKTYLGCLTLLREPLAGLLPEAQADWVFEKIAFYQSVLAADRAGLPSIDQLPSAQSDTWLLSPEEVSELVTLVKHAGIKSQLRVLFPEPQNMPAAREANFPRKKFGMTVEE